MRIAIGACAAPVGLVTLGRVEPVGRPNLTFASPGPCLAARHSEVVSFTTELIEHVRHKDGLLMPFVVGDPKIKFILVDPIPLGGDVRQ